ncbi:MAG: conjugal transfer protein TraF [Syntrophales bacterium]|jgi:conjugal transfer pilus assembly protein TraF|nr:conjugal transfer protein TraF [Syntrophales bacterium]
MNSRIIPALMLAFLVFAVFTSDTVAAKWWENHDEGWFFYHDPEPEPDYDSNPSAFMPDNKTDSLSSELLKKEGERLLSDALVNPTEGNVSNYMRFQKNSMDMSQKFAYVWQRMLMKYPDLYMTTGTEQVNEDIQNAVARLGTQAGLFFIYSAGCDSCRRSAAVVSEFRRKYDGFVVLPVTIDTPLPEFENTRPDNGIAAKLGVETVPSWYLAYPGTDRFEQIGTGYMPLSELERRIYRYAITENMGMSASN